MKRSVSAESPIGENGGPDLFPQPSSSVPPRVTPAPWTGGTALIIWIVALGLSFVVGFVFVLLEILTGVTFSFILSIVITELCFLLPPIFYAVARGGGVGSLGFRMRGSLKAVALGLAVALPAWLVSLVISATVQSILPIPEGWVELFEELVPQTPLELLLMLAATVLVVAPSEEVLSRGFVQQGMENTLGKRRGLLVSSALFGILHLNPWQGVGAFFIALLFGYLFQRVDYNLLTPITAHAVHNSITFALVFLGYA